jgi:NAD(P)H dehydrogenase (quinone)
MTIAVTGATGQLGRLVIDKLKRRVDASQIIALARNSDKAAASGLGTREAHYERPESLAAALDGVDSLLLISGSEIGKRTSQHRNVIDAAKNAGVQHFVYTSVLHADESPLRVAVEHRETEGLIKASGLIYTILRNSWYIENFADSIRQAVLAGSLLGAAGKGRISAASRSDYADAAVAVMLTPPAGSRTLELAGDTAWTMVDLAAEISRQSGKTIPYDDLPETDYAAVLISSGLPAFAAEFVATAGAKFVAGFVAAASAAMGKDALFDEQRQLSTLIGHPTRTLADAVTDALRMGIRSETPAR